jgi:hypothetical protein
MTDPLPPSSPYRLQPNLFGRWVIVNARDRGLAWSGSCWVEHEDGLPTGRAQVSNFQTEDEARAAARDVFRV